MEECAGRILVLWHESPAVCRMVGQAVSRLRRQGCAVRLCADTAPAGCAGGEELPEGLFDGITGVLAAAVPLAELCRAVELEPVGPLGAAVREALLRGVPVTALREGIDPRRPGVSLLPALNQAVERKLNALTQAGVRLAASADPAGPAKAGRRVVTEEDIRQAGGQFAVRPGDLLTPLARDYLRELNAKRKAED